MGEEEEEISGLKPGAFEEGTHDGEPEKSEDQFIGKSMKELIELIELARRTLVNMGDGSYVYKNSGIINQITQNAKASEREKQKWLLKQRTVYP